MIRYSIAILVAAVVAVLVPAPSQTQVLEGRVTASSLNVRTVPGTDSERIDRLDRGKRVIVIDIRGDWAQIGYRNAAGNNRIGWVAGGYLDIQGIVSSTDDAACEPDDVEVRLVRAEPTDLDCDTAIAGRGYDECTVSISVTVARSCRSGEDVDVNLECQAEVTGYKNRDDILGDDYDADETAYFEIDDRDDQATHALDIDIDVEPIQGATTRVEMSDLDCSAYKD